MFGRRCVGISGFSRCGIMFCVRWPPMDFGRLRTARTTLDRPDRRLGTECETSTAAEIRCKCSVFARILRRAAQLPAGPEFPRASGCKAAASFMHWEYQNTSAKIDRPNAAGERWRNYAGASIGPAFLASDRRARRRSIIIAKSGTAKTGSGTATALENPLPSPPSASPLAAEYTPF